jgi:hypothetical protein
MPVRRLLIRSISLAIAVAMSPAGCSSAAVPQTGDGTSQGPAAAVLHADVAFACLWWSEAQMEGLNPNAPPPKKTEVRITKWEYSDPIGVPHPDDVDIVVTIANTSGRAISNVDVELAGEWNEGSRRSAADAVWSPQTVIQTFPTVSIAASGRQTLRAAVSLKSEMDALARLQKWPYGFRATVTVRVRGTDEPLFKTRADLPIRRGD